MSSVHVALNVTFLSTSSLQFTLKSAWNCWTFDGCDYWEKTKTAAWSNIPETMFVGFYESTTCYEVDDTKKALFALNGTYTFPKSRPIRSVMIAESSDPTRRPHFIYSKCPDAERAGLGSTDSDVSAYVVGATITSVAGSGPSSNWNDALPSDDVAGSNAYDGAGASVSAP
ncbi:hypothetical protein PHYSODRAFT_331578 [Phytophthora sojae]|uniref:Uncharacterized protein n=1 Tax=Phytophthora sojae (strain P6497) TaxID=1094619 RepID=G4ZHZ9_PHYSP|nr:hypothetical protein PHYSODRAFT_331578 [Phytophthora sojae]EGZ17642.1 hypothetical protein PHYSODRAFT_331578 [Phytophthora sojae]|eukprot:XP_009526700.1 hypothetical protein PHYSODRAFT_331578 [Phytophthora sojae]